MVGALYVHYLPSYVARVYEKEDHGTTPVLFLIIKESWLLQRPWGGRGRESFAPPPPPPAYAPLTWLFYNGSIVIHLLKTL